MEWKKIASMEYGKIIFHSIPHHVPQKRTDFGKKLFSFVGPKVWQIVPNELKFLTFIQFKQKLKFHFISKYTLD